jgi:hypothetical protein
MKNIPSGKGAFIPIDVKTSSHFYQATAIEQLTIRN